MAQDLADLGQRRARRASAVAALWRSRCACTAAARPPAGGAARSPTAAVAQRPAGARTRGEHRPASAGPPRAARPRRLADIDRAAAVARARPCPGPRLPARQSMSASRAGSHLASAQPEPGQQVRTPRGHASAKVLRRSQSQQSARPGPAGAAGQPRQPPPATFGTAPTSPDSGAPATSEVPQQRPQGGRIPGVGTRAGGGG